MKESHSIDSELVNEVLKGNTHAFETIIAKTKGLVIQIVYKMIENQLDREDLIQEIYLKVYHKLGTFKFKSKLSTWIGTIAYNTCINFLEKKKIPLVEIRDPTANEIERKQKGNKQGSYINSTYRSILKKERAAILQKELKKLPPLYETLITLFHKEELSYNEISKITGLPTGTLKSYLFRARKLLRDNLLNSYNKEDL